MKRFVVLTALGLVSCAQPAPVHPVGTVTQTDFAPWAGSGPATLKGQSSLAPQGGRIITCAGHEVKAIPANEFDSTVLYDSIQGYRVGGVTPTMVALARAATRTTVCDSNGDFEFNNLPLQSWLIETTVNREVSTVFGKAQKRTYLFAHINVQVGDNELRLGQDNIFKDQDNIFNDQHGLFNN